MTFLARIMLTLLMATFLLSCAVWVARRQYREWAVDYDYRRPHPYHPWLFLVVSWLDDWLVYPTVATGLSCVGCFVVLAIRWIWS